MSDISLSKAVRANLLSLQGTAELMAKTQERLATGNKVNSALDNPTNFFTASALNSRAGDLNALMDNMANGIKTIEAADNGLSAVTKTLESMQSTLRQARQDKSFQVGAYDVGADSILKLTGGTLSDSIEVKLDEPYAGKKATVTTTAAYTGPAFGPTQQGGARAEITWNGATMDGTIDLVTVDGIGLDFSDVGITDAATAATAMGTQLGAAYTVTENLGVISVEKVDSSKPSPVVDLGITAATTGSAKFTFDPARMGTTINIDGTDVTVDANLADFTEALRTSLGASYTVTADVNTNEISVRSNTPGAASTPVITGGNLGATPATGSFTLDYTKAQALSIGGNEVLIEAGASEADVIAALEANPGFDADWTVSSPSAGNFEVVARVAGAQTFTISSDARAQSSFTLSTVSAQNLTVGGLAPIAIPSPGTQQDAVDALNLDGAFSGLYEAKIDGGNITIISKTPGAAAANGPAVSSSTPANLAAVTATDVAINYASPATAIQTEAGKAAVPVTQAPGVDGSTVANFAAPADVLTVTYGIKTFDLSITSGTQEQMAEAIDNQFAQAGVALKATFDATGKLGFESTTPEAKTLAVSGATANTLFGASTVSVGEAAVAPLNATKAVDKFVEQINRDHGTSVRASNDNGRLRIENLSTTAMVVDTDKDGNGAITTSTIGGNAVRASLADQYNDLKNQLDRLSDDASFNGINLLRGDNLRISFNESGNSFIDIQTSDKGGLNANTLKIAELIPADLDADIDIDSVLAEIKPVLERCAHTGIGLWVDLSIVQNRQDFTKEMINTLQSGAANLTLADMNEEACQPAGPPDEPVVVFLVPFRWPARPIRACCSCCSKLPVTTKRYARRASARLHCFRQHGRLNQWTYVRIVEAG